LFFVLSGFLIGGILMKNRNSESYFKTFYIRRFFRIFPLYYLVLLLLIIISTKLGNIPGIYYATTPNWAYLTYTQNIYSIFNLLPSGITWSLAVEEQFYLFFPLLIFYIKPKYYIKVFIFGFILANILRLLYPEQVYLELLIFRIDALITGAAIAYYLQINDIKEKLVNKTKLLFLLLISLIVILSLLIISDLILLPVINTTLLFIFFDFIYGLMIILAVICKDNLYSKFLRNKLLQKIGLVSYGIYLYHWIVLGAVFKFINKSSPNLSNSYELLLILLSIGITFGVSLLSYYIFEKPFLKIGLKAKY
jgi:peptidoglycan/LPS O-acetylase OafA/YrhL